MRIYFMGICGSAMGNAALLVREQGHEVCGSDSGVYPPMSDVLADAGIEVFDGYDADRLAKLQPDRVVVGNVISRGNVEVEWLLNQSEMEFISLPQLFHDTVLVGRCPIVITGTHGKTTTSTLTAFLLSEAGSEPGWLIGGVPRDLPGGARLGSGQPFVLEGDEYDSAFFDKRSKFIHYRPQVAVLNNLEFDHADIFRDLQDVQRSFRHFLRIIPSKGFAIVNGDDANIKALLPVSWTQVVKVGTGRENDLIIADFKDGKDGASFDLIWKGNHWTRVEWSQHGLFNAYNAAMAGLAAAFASGFTSPVEFDLSALSHFKGVQRRQDVLYSGPRCVVLEDFGHHPTAIAATLEGIRAAYPDNELIAVFEPRSNTACTSIFQEAFTEAFAFADRVYIGAVHRAEKIAADKRLDTKKIAKVLSDKGCTAMAFDSNEALMEEIRTQAPLMDGVVLVFFTNGSFDAVQHKTAALFSDAGE
ncbi:MAG: UDP-N-acetylmuramate: L-alanyl-gamma-D-glutamyl-meso-diaminopimelate ligase [Lentimonas sp.]|jgi:UDP-N-acetylmuramate: L-alanyl-gamma-D-glutamyl-meso-diaminopimelate ligase